MMYLMIQRGKQWNKALSLRRACFLLGVSRSGYYDFLSRRKRGELSRGRFEMSLRDKIQRIVVLFPGYGYRRVTKTLQRDHQICANHKRVLRLMRADNLLCLRRRRFVVTTDSDHNFPVYSNLVRGIEVTGINQVWVSDITYIHLSHEFVYLAVIVDVYSRRCVGWALGRCLDTDLTLEALYRALRARWKPEFVGLIHHSDQGVQYASRVYTECLREHRICISMSRKGNPYDNAFAESFMKTLKYEEVYLNEYETFEEAQKCIYNFIEDVYNEKRLHSSLGYRTPKEFERMLEMQTYS